MLLRRAIKIIGYLVLSFLVVSCAGGPGKESTGEYLDSSLITAKVKAKLIDDPLTNAIDIKVVTFKGVVQLSGFVGSDKEKQRAGAVAADIVGVKEVKNDLVVKSPNHQ